jgi:hypothetical protein
MAVLCGNAMNTSDVVTLWDGLLDCLLGRHLGVASYFDILECLGFRVREGDVANLRLSLAAIDV